MRAEASGVSAGVHFLDGDQAACEGALAAGCRFVAGYPITPSTEIVERFAQRIPLIGGVFIQMEDELASSIAILGAAWGGLKVMTVTSGPGLSLMMEHVGYAAMTETPCVFVDVQRGGPSTGLPTHPAQGDMMQVKWGSHGDYEPIALSPNSPQECFDLMIRAFNLAEQYRVPVFFMMDEVVGHMTERVVIPEAGAIEVAERRWSRQPPGQYQPYGANGELVPDMVKAGDGYRLHITGLTHNAQGYPAMQAAAQRKLIERLVGKVRQNRERLVEVRMDYLEDAEIGLVSFGITSRVAMAAIEKARRRGVKVGHLRLVITWPFPSSLIRKLAGRVKAFLVPELNMGQMVLEVERAVAGKVPVLPIPHPGGTVHEPEEILQRIMEAAR
jgi:2-oxoglutarate/2-oxoacid ferredoxin oxidoreductase subunit alpha